MAIQLKVTPEQLRATAGTVSTLLRTLQGDFDALQQKVDRTRYYWTGEAGNHYRTHFAARKQDTQSILSRLAQYPPDLLQMAGIYADTEEHLEESFAGLRSDFIQ